MRVAAAPHRQQPHLRRQAMFLLLSGLAHGLVLWSLPGYPHRAVAMQMREADAIQVEVLSAPRNLGQPALPMEQRATPTPHRLAPQPASLFATNKPATEVITQVAAPSPAVSLAPAQTNVQAAANVTTAPATSTNKSTAATTTTSTSASTVEKAAAPALLQGHPDYAYNPPPDYPMTLREQGLGGVVWLRVWVDSEGHPADILLGKSSGYRLLDDAAMRAVRTWRFVPARLGDQRQSSWVEFPIRFATSG